MILSDDSILAYGMKMSFVAYSRIRSYDFLNKVLMLLGLISGPVANDSWFHGFNKYANEHKKP